MSINLNNAETWTTRDEVTCRIDELEERHARNILRFLERHADRFEFVSAWNLMTSLPDEMGDMAEECVMSDLENDARDPVSWMRHQPAYKAIRAHLDRLDKVIPDLGEVW